MSEAKILYLNRADIAVLAGQGGSLVINGVESALRMHAARQFVQPLKPYLRWRGEANHVADRIIAMPAYVGGDRPIAGLKWIGSKHDNPSGRGMERASALIILNDAETHYPIAVLEGALISSLRTAAVTALAVRHLANPESKDLTCLGCGPIGRTHLEMLLSRFPGIRRVHLFDLNVKAARELADKLTGENPLVEIRVAESAEKAVRQGDIVVTCTVAEKPYLRFGWLKAGAFLANVSIMDVHKEVFLQVDKVVVDDWDQCNREKKVINQLVEEGLFSREKLHAELGEIIAGLRPGRESKDERILLNPMGMAIEDVAAAQSVYHEALKAGRGRWLDLY